MVRVWAGVGIVLLAVAGCAPVGYSLASPKIEADRQAILEILDDYARALETADADLMGSLFWFKDYRFVEWEDGMEPLIDRTLFLWLLEQMREGAKPGIEVHLSNTHVYFLTPNTATSFSSLVRSEGGEARVSRVTFIYKKLHGEWRIIQGHSSLVPGCFGSTSGSEPE